MQNDVVPVQAYPSVPVDPVPTLRIVQLDLLSRLDDAARAAGSFLCLADITLKPRPTVWICGTTEQHGAVIDAIRAQGILLFQLGEGRRDQITTLPENAFSAICGWHYGTETFQVHGSASGVEVEFCHFDAGRNSWRAARSGTESEADAGSLDSLPTFDFHGLTLPILRNALAVWHQHPASRGIDVVYTWVDGSDPAWQARKAQAGGTPTVRAADDPARFQSGRELLFSVLSVRRYLGDLRRIFIVTDGQVPDFLGDLLNEVTIIDHREIFADPSHLPTFNSHAIEAQLHRIPGLSRHYLYFNDDVILSRAMSAASFFDEYGRSYQFPSGTMATPSGKVGVTESAVDAAARNNRRLLAERFGIHAFRKFKHTPIAIDRDVMVQMEQDFPEAWQATLPNRFRSSQDHSISGHLYFHYAAVKGRSATGQIRYGYFDLGEPRAPDQFSLLLQDDWRRFDCFCMNEVQQTAYSDENRAAADQFMSAIFPQDGVHRFVMPPDAEPGRYVPKPPPKPPAPRLTPWQRVKRRVSHTFRGKA
jgi:hypothetical protein